MVIQRKKERGAALIEAAITIPLILLICVAIFDLGRAYQTWQVLTNAAREGARVSIIAGRTDEDVQAAVRNYVRAGGLVEGNIITINRNQVTLELVPPATTQASQVVVDYHFNFMVLGPVMRLVNRTSTLRNDLTMRGVAVMRNEN